MANINCEFRVCLKVVLSSDLKRVTVKSNKMAVYEAVEICNKLKVSMSVAFDSVL